jgi:hypothetical protein
MLENMAVGTWYLDTIGCGDAGWFTAFHTVNVTARGVLALAAISNTQLPNGAGVAVAIRRYTYTDSSGVNQTVELPDTRSDRGAVIRPNSMRIDNATSITFELGMNGGGWAQAICMVISW